MTRKIKRERKFSNRELVDYYFKQDFWLIKLRREQDNPEETKKPAVEWQNKPRPTKHEVLNWLNEGYGLGVACGRRSKNLIDIDIDEPKLYVELWGQNADWERKTLVICSSKGKQGKKRHLYFKVETPVNTQHYAHKGVKIDVIGEGNYAALPPTIHPTTRQPYEFESDLNKDVLKWDGNFLEEFLTLMQERLGFKPKIEEIKVEELFLPRSEGDRHFWEIRIVTWLKECQSSKETAWEKVVEWNNTNDSPLPHSELEYQFNNIWQKPLKLIKFDRKPTEYFSKETMEKAEKALGEKPFESLLDGFGELHTGDEELAVAEYLSAISPKLSKPTINIWEIGRSQIGKSHLKYSVAEATLPKDYYEIFTSASPLSFFYYVKKYGENAFDGMLIYIDEVEGSKDTLPMLRSLTGQTDITPRHLSVYDAEILDLKIKGRRAVWFTSVKAFGREQLRNRFLFSNPDETIKQDLKIATLQTREYFNNVKIDRTKLDVAKAMTMLIVQNTKDLDVDFSYGFTWSFTSLRYLLPLFISMLKLCTKVNYKNRKINEKGNLVSEPEDFEIVKTIWRKMEKEILYRVNRSCQRIIDVLSSEREEAKTTAEISKELGRATDWAYVHLKELSESGLINADKRADGRVWEYWLATLPRIEDITLLKEPQIKLPHEFPKNPEGSTKNANSAEGAGKIGNSCSASKRGDFQLKEKEGW